MSVIAIFANRPEACPLQCRCDTMSRQNFIPGLFFGLVAIFLPFRSSGYSGA